MTRPSRPPLYSLGQRIKWADGSRGRVVSPPEWRAKDIQGEWYYGVQFGDQDSLLWLLPEGGLRLLDE